MEDPLHTTKLPRYSSCGPPPPAYYTHCERPPSAWADLTLYLPAACSTSSAEGHRSPSALESCSERSDSDGWSWCECIAMLAILLVITGATVAGALVDAKH